MSLATELYAALFAALLGFFLSFCYDAFSVLRILFDLFDAPPISPRLLSFSFPFLPSPALRSGRKKGAALRFALLFLFDFTYALAAGVAFILFLYAFHDGVFRLFLLLSCALAFLLYRLTLGRLVFRVLGTVAFLLRVLLSYLALAVRLPLSLLANALVFFARTLASFLLSLASRALASFATRLSLFVARKGTDTFFSATTK